jgi:hypothetical protein
MKLAVGLVTFVLLAQSALAQSKTLRSAHGFLDDGQPFADQFIQNLETQVYNDAVVNCQGHVSRISDYNVQYTRRDHAYFHGFIVSASADFSCATAPEIRFSTSQVNNGLDVGHFKENGDEKEYFDGSSCQPPPLCGHGSYAPPCC